MHLYLHDYAGHPFQVELSRALASRGWKVTHAYFKDDPGPKGNLDRNPGDPIGLSFRPLSVPRRYSKTNLVRRRAGDRHYGRTLAQDISALKPDIVLSGNTPTEAQEFVSSLCRKQRIPFVFWCQDFYSIAVERLLRDKFGPVGSAIGNYYKILERRQMRQASHIIHITEDFCKVTDGWGIHRSHVSVIQNWASLGAIKPMRRRTKWAEDNQIASRPRVVYTGTLGMKHNPSLLQAVADDGVAQVIVVAAGSALDALSPSERLQVFPLQPFDKLSEVLATSDVLVAMIEPEAADFSVPSKILSYLCAGRPIVLSAPRRSLAARILLENEAGLVVPPGDKGAFVAAVKRILADRDLASRLGQNARAYAEVRFNIETITDTFETALGRALGKEDAVASASAAALA